MAKLFDKLKFYWDLSTKRYQAFPATDPADVQACVEILEEVRKNELNRVAGASVLESHAFAGEKLDYTLMACKVAKTGEIIGCMRITPAVYAKTVPASRTEYALDSIPEEFLKSLQIFTRLAVLKPYRKTPAALILMAASVVQVLKAGGQGALIACEPNLFTMYQRLGLRPIGSLHNSPSGGYRIPMLFLPDEKYLKAIKSPALRWAKGVDFNRFEAIIQWFRNRSEGLHLSHLGMKPLESAGLNPKVYQILTEGLSQRGNQAFLQNALVIKCQENDVLVAEEDGGKGLGIVLKGKVEVIVEGKTLVRLDPGELFGEIAFVLDTRRTASLIAAAPDTQVLLFSTSAYQRLSDEADKTTLWRNLARVLAKRVLTSDKLIS